MKWMVHSRHRSTTDRAAWALEAHVDQSVDDREWLADDAEGTLANVAQISMNDLRQHDDSVIANSLRRVVDEIVHGTTVRRGFQSVI
jgi:hypothetical protein